MSRNVIGGLFMSVVIGMAPSIWVVKSYFEARAYNRITGEHVSTLDAMFVELRIVSQAKGSE